VHGSVIRQPRNGHAPGERHGQAAKTRFRSKSTARCSYGIGRPLSTGRCGVQCSSRAPPTRSSDPDFQGLKSTFSPLQFAVQVSNKTPVGDQSARSRTCGSGAECLTAGPATVPITETQVIDGIHLKQQLPTRNSMRLVDEGDSDAPCVDYSSS